MSNMRVAVAALLIAREINESTSHQLVILSRSHRATLISQGYQCQVVDYSSDSSLRHALMGIDTVISTVTGTPQLRLIEAAVQCRVRRFIPAEFEGQPGLRGQNHLLDRGRNAALTMLQYYRASMRSTVFVCGILYERFAVNGMRSHGIGVTTGYGNEGDYIAHARNMTCAAPVYDGAQNLACLCLTSAWDVARFVVRSLDMPEWPAEMSMCGERMTVHTLINTIRACRNRNWSGIEYHNPATLQYQIGRAQANSDVTRERRLAPLLATAEGRYDFIVPAYLNSIHPDITPMGFRQWFELNWASIP